MLCLVINTLNPSLIHSIGLWSEYPLSRNVWPIEYCPLSRSSFEFRWWNHYWRWKNAKGVLMKDLKRKFSLRFILIAFLPIFFFVLDYFIIYFIIYSTILLYILFCSCSLLPRCEILSRGSSPDDPLLIIYLLFKDNLNRLGCR